MLNELVAKFCPNIEFFLIRFFTIFCTLLKFDKLNQPAPPPAPAIKRTFEHTLNLPITRVNIQTNDKYDKFCNVIFDIFEKIKTKQDIVDSFKKHGILLANKNVEIEINLNKLQMDNVTKSEDTLFSVRRDYFDKMQMDEYVNLVEYIEARVDDAMTEKIDILYNNPIVDDFQKISQLTNDRLILLYLIGGNVNPIVTLKNLSFDTSNLNSTICIKNFVFNTKKIIISFNS